MKLETTAETWGRFFEAIPATDEGWKLPGVWNRAVKMAQEEAISVKADNSQGNEDPTRELTFPDGSILEIANPNQECFSGFIRVIV